MKVADLGRERETPAWLMRIYGWYSAVRCEGELMSKPARGRYEKRLQSRLDTIGWGLLFLLIAALALPGGPAEYAGVAVVGGSMIVLNLARLAFGLPVRWFSVVLGGSMAIAGSSAFLGIRMDVFVLFFALAGAVNIAAALGRKERLPDPESAGGAS